MWENKQLHKSCFFGANAANMPLSWNRRSERQNQGQQRDTQNSPQENAQAATENSNRKCYVFTPELQLTVRRPLK